VATIDQSDMTK